MSHSVHRLLLEAQPKRFERLFLTICVNKFSDYPNIVWRSVASKNNSPQDGSLPLHNPRSQ